MNSSQPNWETMQAKKKKKISVFLFSTHSTWKKKELHNLNHWLRQKSMDTALNQIAGNKERLHLSRTHHYHYQKKRREGKGRGLFTFSSQARQRAASSAAQKTIAAAFSHASHNILIPFFFLFFFYKKDSFFSLTLHLLYYRTTPDCNWKWDYV